MATSQVTLALLPAPADLSRPPAASSSYSSLIGRINRIVRKNAFYVKDDRVITSKVERLMHFLSNLQTYSAYKAITMAGGNYLASMATKVNELIETIDSETEMSIPRHVSEFFMTLKEGTTLEVAMSTAENFRELEAQLNRFVETIRANGEQVMAQLGKLDIQAGNIRDLTRALEQETARSKSIATESGERALKIDELRGQIKELNDQQSSNEEAQARLRTEAKAREQELRALIDNESRDKLALSKHAEDLQEQVSTLEGKQKTLHAYTKAYGNSLAFNGEVLETMEKLHNQEMAEKADKEAELRRELKKLTDQLADLQARSGKVQATQLAEADMQEQAQSKLKRDLVSAIEDKNSVLQERNLALAERDALKDDISRIQAKLAQAQKEKAELQEKNAEWIEIHAADQREIASLRDCLAEKDVEIAGLKAKNAELQKSCQELKERMEGQQKQHAGEISARNSEIRKLLEQDKQQAAQLDGLLKDLQGRDEMLKNRALQATLLHQELSSTQKEAAHLKTALSDVETEQERLRVALAKSLNLGERQADLLDEFKGT